MHIEFPGLLEPLCVVIWWYLQLPVEATCHDAMIAVLAKMLQNISGSKYWMQQKC
jgi:hypothetical protein